MPPPPPLLSRDQAQAEVRAARSDVSLGQAVRTGVFASLGEHQRTLLKVVGNEPRSPGAVQALVAHLDDASSRRRRRFLAVLAPHLADELDRWWVWSATQPYQQGWTRRPFRHPDPAVSGPRRLEELAAYLSLAAAYRGKGLDWFAAWAPHLGWQEQQIGRLLASEISHGATGWVDHLADHVAGRVPSGGMGAHVVVGLLAADHPAGWEVVEDLLLKAQRQEGLRQSILEAVDLSHPEAFRRMLQLLVDERLTRFAATIRAAGVWFGENLDVRQDAQLADHLRTLAGHLADPAALPADADGTQAYLALWAGAFTDVAATVPRAVDLLGSDVPDQRLAAARLLAEADLPEARRALEGAFGDPDRRVLAVALRGWEAQAFRAREPEVLGEAGTAALLEVLEQEKRAAKVQIGLLGPAEASLGAGQVADVLVKYADASTPERTARLAPAYAKATAEGRGIRVRRLAEHPQANRRALLEALGDAAEHPRRTAAQALAGVERITADEAVVLEALLTRKAGDVRKHALTFLVRQDASAVAASVDRLAAGTAQQQAGAEALARAAGVPIPATGAGKDAPAPLPVLADVIGLDHARRTPSVRPQPSGDFTHLHRPIEVLLTSLMAWLDEHRDVEVTIHDDGGSEVRLLADLRRLGSNAPDGSPPLPGIIGPWWERAQPLLPGGGVETLLVSGLTHHHAPGGRWAERAVRSIVGRVPGRYEDHDRAGLAPAVIDHLAARSADPSWVGPVLDAVCTLAAALPQRGFHADPAVSKALGERVPAQLWQRDPDPRYELTGPLTGALSRWFRKGLMTPEQEARYWALLRFLDEPLGRHDPRTDAMVASPERAAAYGVPVDAPEALVPCQPHRRPMEAAVLFRAHARGLATRDDVLDQLVRHDDVGGSWQFRGHVLREVGTRRPPAWFTDDPAAVALVEEVASAALEIERQRDDHDTTATHVVRELRTARGIPVLVGYLEALGTRSLTRGYAWTRHRDAALSHVVRMVCPAEGETAADLAAAVRAAGVTQKRLVEVAVYAPQWAGLVEEVLDWPGLEDAVWWLHAHTKGDDWTVDAELRKEWEAEVARRTPLDALDLTRGAADVEMFHGVVGALGEERFDVLLKAAKLASSSGGHKRAELFAQALLGRVDRDDLVARITGKRHQDSVRALGLVPLASSADLLERYELLRGFVASDRASGSQRRASEAAAVDIGLENLARSAGYRDPQRLVWAMEAQAVADLADGPAVVHDDDLAVSLSIADGVPEISVRRGDKPLKSVPRASAKHPEVAALRERATRLRKQASRMRSSLEQAMVTGEQFTPDELDELYRHPLLRPQLADLVAVDGEGRCGFLGLAPDHLVDAAGERLEVTGPVRVAHPHDLLASGSWPDLQHALFVAKRTQPFRQVFRELYTVTDAERTDRGSSQRYAGHQVASRQAAGLFRSRGWVADFEAGFTRTHHAERVTAAVSLLDGWGSPTEVGDATLDRVWFARTGTGTLLDLDDVPPRLFSETMRDLDLVVSVAHSGGFDPESSTSTVEMRRRLVEETCAMLGLDDVETTDHHAVVRGQIGTYSVNLGSGSVHRQPGNAVCIVPVHAQHRGRVFLPFVDDDPRTAEVVAKVVMLARDDRIQDPTILAQLRG